MAGKNALEKKAAKYFEVDEDQVVSAVQHETIDGEAVTCLINYGIGGTKKFHVPVAEFNAGKADEETKATASDKKASTSKAKK